MLARFPGGGVESAECSDWVTETILRLKDDPRVDWDKTQRFRISDTPITMGRNRAVKCALEAKVDFLLMVDSDMSPDLPVPGAKPFWPNAFDFALRHYSAGPCSVAAPYCGPPPFENVYVFRFANAQSDHPDPDHRVEQFSREEAAARTGFESVAALPTGLILFDMRAFRALPPKDGEGWFRYEWTDQHATHKASTEDVVLTRDLCLLGIPQYVYWDAWAGHIKQKVVGKPQVITADMVAANYRAAVLKGNHSLDRVVHVNEGVPRVPPPPRPLMRRPSLPPQEPLVLPEPSTTNGKGGRRRRT